MVEDVRYDSTNDYFNINDAFQLFIEIFRLVFNL